MIKNKELEDRLITACCALKKETTREIVRKIYNDFDITNVFWDVLREEVEMLGKGFSITVADI